VLTYTVDGPVAWLTLNRPTKLNAMTPAFWGELRSLLVRAEEDANVRALVFRGSGSCFSVGGDIACFGELADESSRRTYVTEALGALAALDACTKPTIAAVHGHALGGGCELTMVCDIVVADETARFGTPESAVGLLPGLAVVRGRAHLNLHWIKYLVLTGETIDVHEAKAAGLVNRVTPAGAHETVAEKLARTIATRAPLALALGKEILNRDDRDGYGYAIEAVTYLQGSADAAEGITAFERRRDPLFVGR
jgi:enoyl-CoA hydratase/carnithine racemase